MPVQVLVADDSATIVKILSLALSAEEYEIQSVATAADATRLLNESPPQIFLVDISLPDQNGLELTRLIKTTPSMQNVRVAVLANAFDPVDESECKSAGVDEIIIKPFDPSDLRAKMKRMLSLAADLPPPAPSQKSAATSPAQNLENFFSAEMQKHQPQSQPDSAPEPESAETTPLHSDLPVAPAGATPAPPIGQPSLIDNDIITAMTDNSPPPAGHIQAPLQGEAPPAPPSGSAPPEDHSELPVSEPANTVEQDHSDAFATTDAQPGSQFLTPDTGATPVLDLSEELNEWTPRMEPALERELSDWSSEGSRFDIGDATFRFSDNYLQRISLTGDMEPDELGEALAKPPSNQHQTQQSLEIKGAKLQTGPSNTATRLDRGTDNSADTAINTAATQQPQISSTDVERIMREEIRAICFEMAEKVAWEVIPELAENIVRSELKKIMDDLDANPDS